MNKKRFLLLLSAIMLLGGCSLAQPTMESKSNSHLVGVYLVSSADGEHILHDENWVEYGSESMNTKYGKIDIPRTILPAVYDEVEHDFTFPGLKGYAFFDAEIKDGDAVVNTAISDLENHHFGVTSTDFGTTYDLSGTLYVAEGAPERLWTVYHVYQAEDGTVYLDGSGNTYQGNSFSTTLTEDFHTTTGSEEKSASTKIEVSVKEVPRTERLLVHQYNASGQKIGTAELPLSFDIPPVTWEAGAAWAILEERSGAHITRTACDRPARDEEPAAHTVYIFDDNNVGQSSVITFAEPANT